MNNSPGPSRAVIIGGGIVGLLAARVLSEHFQCTLIEADRPPESPEPRKGAPQTTQPHILFARGYRIIEELFPVIGSDLLAYGALPIDWATEFYRYDRLTGWSATGGNPSEIRSVTCSRPLLEWCIRQRVYSLKNLEFLEGSRVIGLLSSPDQSKITGVRVQQKDHASEELSADLVVDAGGRFSQAPKWLEALGLEAPEEKVVDPYLGYATRRYRSLQDYQDRWKVILISQTPPDDKRLGYLAQIENGEWIATVGGFGGDYPPSDEQGFLEFAKSLADPKIYEAIKNAQPQSSIYTYRATANRLRYYENTRLPEGFVSIGDAVCALCPIYGQGITQGAQSVLVLRDWLANSRGLFKDALNPSSFHKKLAKSNASYWSMATGMDLKFPSTKQFPPVEAKPKKEPSQLGRWMRNYALSLQHGTSVDPELNMLFMKVIHQVASPLIFFHPAVVLRVLRAAKKP